MCWQNNTCAGVPFSVFCASFENSDIYLFRLLKGGGGGKALQTIGMRAPVSYCTLPKIPCRNMQADHICTVYGRSEE